MRVLVLVDGEHYPPVTRWGIDVARTHGHEVEAALLVGGVEKIDPRRPPDLGVPVRLAAAASSTSTRPKSRRYSPSLWSCSNSGR